MVRRKRKRSRGFKSILVKVFLFLLLVFLLPVLLFGWVPPPISSFMFQSYVTAWWSGDFDYRVNYQWVDWDSISSDARLAVVASEDQLFPSHAGFDLDAIKDAIQEYKAGGQLRGASTISQQVAKNLFLWSGKSYFRKGLEAWFTALIEICWSKQRILEVYLNIAEFGKGIYGVEAAAQLFFHKQASELNGSEAALLAAVLPNPLMLDAANPSQYIKKRRAWILEQMRRLGGSAYLKEL